MIENNKVNKMDKFNNFLQKSLNSQRRAQTKAEGREVTENPFTVAKSDIQDLSADPGRMSHWNSSQEANPNFTRNGFHTSVIHKFNESLDEDQILNIEGNQKMMRLIKI